MEIPGKCLENPLANTLWCPLGKSLSCPPLAKGDKGGFYKKMLTVIMIFRQFIKSPLTPARQTAGGPLFQRGVDRRAYFKVSTRLSEET